jgi:hypothetical protein
MPDKDAMFERATAEANEIFGKLGSVIDERIKGGATSMDVTEVARDAGLELDDRMLAELKVTRLIPVHPFIPWHVWFPWRPLWCWWWNFRYPWYHCCPWWWHRCHWYTL